MISKGNHTLIDRLIFDARAICHAALAGVDPGAMLARRPLAEWVGAPPERFQTIRIVGAGKGGIPMALAAERALAPRAAGGLVVVPHGYRATWRGEWPSRIEILEAGHPTPDGAGLDAAERALQLARAGTADDLLLVLLSGGGSALWPAFADGIDLAAARETFGLLLRSGAAIHEVNTVRKHLSRIGGGRLAVAAAPAAVCALIVSDVPGDDLSVISSGPTVADSTTFADAWAVVERFGLPDRIPGPVRDWLNRGLADPALETPKPGDPALGRCRNHLIGSNRLALEAAAHRAEALGYRARIAAEPLAGEARAMGRRIAQTALNADGQDRQCFIWGGETTVTVRGSGRGGRNQEVALGAALAIDGAARSIAVLSCGSDGIDGPTDAAGALATPQTLGRARALGFDAETALRENDAYPFFDALGGLLRSGPTHTNVMDVALAIVAPKPG